MEKILGSRIMANAESNVVLLTLIRASWEGEPIQVLITGKVPGT